MRLNKLTFTTDEDGHGVVYRLKVDWPVLGKKLKSSTKDVKQGLATVSSAQVKEFLITKSIVVGGITLTEEDLQVQRFPDFVNIRLGRPRCGSRMHNSLRCKSQQ